MIVVKITSGSKSTVKGTGAWAWVNNAGETDIYATTVASDKTVSELITAYEAGGAKDIVKLPAGSSKRLRANNRPVIIFGADAGIAEVDLTNTEVSPFKVQAKGGDDGNIEPISITANGTYTASGDVKGYSPVSVSVQPNVDAKSISANGTYDAEDDDLDGYSSVTVAVSKDFYPKAHATLDDVSRVEGDDMRVYPMEGADYYPYVYLGAKPYGTQEEFEPVGKYFEGRATEHLVGIFLDLIDTTTGESATGYPQRVAASQANYSIVSGGWARIKAWSLKENGSQVSVTMERYNPTYTKPTETTHTSATVQPSGALDAYLNAEYYIDGGAGESVRLDTLTVTANGTYTAPTRTAYDEVIVDVQEQPWEPLEDGYSNFWFELTDDTLSPWLNFNAKNNDAVIDWGDGSGEVALDTLTPTHTYAKAGKYVVKVKGVTGIAQQVNPTTAQRGGYLNILKAVELNAEVVRSASGMFLYMCGLRHAVFNGDFTTIEQNCFRNNGLLEEFVIPDTVTVLRPYAFSGTSLLKTITIPASVVNIGGYTFANCPSLSVMHMLPTTPPTLGSSAITSFPSDYIIYVPVGYGETYKTEWSDYADHILEEGQTPNRAMLSALSKANVDDADTDEKR